jgi:hypothetical protein
MGDDDFEDDIEDDEEKTVAQDDEDEDEYMDDLGDDEDEDSAFFTVDSRCKDLDGLKKSGRNVRGESGDAALLDRVDEAYCVMVLKNSKRRNG